jgi:hypothetical protein
MPHSIVSQFCYWFSTTGMLVSLSFFALGTQAQDWEAFTDESTREVQTVDQNAQEHWSELWLVVMNGQLYLRLGTRAAARVEGNTKKPFVSIKSAEHHFDNVRVIPEPEMVEQVAAAIAKKYPSDLIIRWIPHPLTVRLERGT